MLKLYDYWRSGAGYRVRIALALKGAAFERIVIDLSAGAQKDAAYKAHNPQGFVPALVTDDGQTITQSWAIVEWLEETRPAPALLPADPLARAKVRAIAGAVACDIHPINNMRILQHLKRAYALDDGGVRAWAVQWIREGFAALETLLADGPGGPWAWGEEPGFADVFAVPQIFAGVSRYGLDMSPFPRLAEIERAAATHPAFLAAHPDRQSDKPA